MTDNEINTVVGKSIKKAPEYLWNRIINNIARDIAEELLTELESQKAPCKQESMDRVNALIAFNTPKQYMKGA
jgi:hypothetical protein